MIVGVLEQFDDFLMALEDLLPRYFKGALELSKDQHGMINHFYRRYCDLCRYVFFFPVKLHSLIRYKISY